MGPCVRRDDTEGWPRIRAARPAFSKVSDITIIYSPKPAEKPPVARLNDDAINPVSDQLRCFHPRRITRRPSQSSGEDSMSKRIALLSAAAFSALAFTATIIAPASAEEKTVMVGGAAMFPSKNIVQNAVNSKDHTTLVAAVKAAGLVETLESKGPFTVFAPTNTAFGKLPAGTVDTLVKPENKATLTKILTYHVVPGKLAASDLKDGMKLKTAEGEQLSVKLQDGKVWIVDAKGGTAMVTISNVNQSNGVIHVVDTVLMPAS
jgi:uncharacterized surface protein with fasciclin (FAS1) repeats